MKCPHCGQETSDGKTCRNCGKNLAPSQGMEVQYKDFKVSELLEIKLHKQVPAGQEIPETVEGQEKHQPSAGKRRWLLVVTAVLAAATTVFFILRFMIKY